MKYIGIIAAVLCIPAAVFGVMFASDTVVFTDNGTRITDNTVVVMDSVNSVPRLAEGGKLQITQNSEALKLTVYRSAEPLVTKAQWDKDMKELEKTYDLYLEDVIGKNGLEIVIPAPADRSTHDSPPPGMTGGIIGRPRSFTIDISAGTLTENREPEPDTVSEPESAPAENNNLMLLAVSIAVVAVMAGAVLKIRKKKKQQ